MAPSSGHERAREPRIGWLVVLIAPSWCADVTNACQRAIRAHERPSWFVTVIGTSKARLRT
jgi:hypothetical protein